MAGLDGLARCARPGLLTRSGEGWRFPPSGDLPGGGVPVMGRVVPRTGAGAMEYSGVDPVNSLDVSTGCDGQ
jgi:hypothetical protein